MRDQQEAWQKCRRHGDSVHRPVPLIFWLVVIIAQKFDKYANLRGHVTAGTANPLKMIPNNAASIA